MTVFDTEFNGLFDADKMHVLSYHDGKRVVSIKPEEVEEWVSTQKVLIGHNIVRYDIPTMSRVLGFSIKLKLVDTLALSWYLFPERNEHGLEAWGVDFGVPKPPVTDWQNLTYEQYCHRCEEDVKINLLIWKECQKYLSLLYECSMEDVINLPIISYLSFKLSCAAEQERSMWKVDKEKCEEGITLLTKEVATRTDALKAIMPKVPKIVKKTRPAKPFKKDGSRSAHGEAWFSLLAEKGIPEGYMGAVDVVSHWEEPKPTSSDQVKSWLFSLGWVPTTLKYVKEDDGSLRTIPQVRREGEEGKELCPSVKALIAKAPEVQELEGLTVAQHRLGLLVGFIRDIDENDCVRAQIAGLTNTLRFKHKTVVNLPGVHKAYGSLVRGCLVAREGYELCGSDMSGLENKISDHFIHKFDPEYVEKKNSPGYDPHLETAVVSSLMTEDELKFFKWYKKEHK